MRTLLLTLLLAGVSAAETGVFTKSDDVGGPALKGAVEFDGKQYKVTGAGADIWGRSDQFHYLWREMTGNFTLTATAKFLSEGNAHRKAVLMLRKSLDADAPFVHLAIHGDGMPSLQFRTTKGDTVNTVDFPVEGPGTWKLRLQRQGGTITVWAAKDGAPMRELGHTNYQTGTPMLAGLGVSSHNAEAKCTVEFSDVSFDSPLGTFTNSGDVGGPAIPGSVEYANGQYRITGAGANMWAKQDQFHYAWKQMTGNFTATATVRFLDEGNEHRKAGIVVRQSLDTDAAYAHTAIHGNGMPGLQWRNRKGEDTNTFDLPFDGPGTFQVRMVRNGVRIYMYVGKNGAPLKEIMHTEVTFQGPVLVGLAVCSHDPAKSETALFSDVSIEAMR
jgi:regulation of enolase protein 1 (concanavalin A-like superfamily)